MSNIASILGFKSTDISDDCKIKSLNTHIMRSFFSEPPRLLYEAADIISLGMVINRLFAVRPSPFVIIVNSCLSELIYLAILLECTEEVFIGSIILIDNMIYNLVYNLI